MKRYIEKISFVLGLLLLLAYGYSARPFGLARGYTEDMCNHEMARQIMSENLAKTGRPSFAVDQVMAPEGINGAYFAGWNIERDWLGAYVWLWNRDFPFMWAYFLVSLTISYVGTGWIARKLVRPPAVAWWIALAVVGFNLPRHFKLWYHSDNVMLHWVYLGFFLDAWIWSRFIRERRVSLELEAWRIFLLQANFGTMGYMWGPTILEWLVMRVAMVWIAIARRRAGSPVTIAPLRTRRIGAPMAAIVILLGFQLVWFLPYLAAAMKFGSVIQDTAYFAHGGYLFRPVWLDSVLPSLGIPVAPLSKPETLVTIGWFYLVPFFLVLRLLRRKAGGPGFAATAPFVITLVIGALYLASARPVIVLVQTLVPIMKFFRTASRWGLFLPPLATCVILLGWPELTAWARRGSGKWTFRIALIAFTLSSIAEVTWLATPVVAFQPMPSGAADIYARVRALPGTTVLTLPFCVVGANGVCGEEECGWHPSSTIGACSRIFHDKKVYGVYASRLSPEDCEIYRKPPFTAWFSAWKLGTCPSDADWSSMCAYLGSRPELSALLVYPEIWLSGEKAKNECRDRFRKYLGEPIAGSEVDLGATRGGTGADRSRVLWFNPRCVSR